MTYNDLQPTRIHQAMPSLFRETFLDMLSMLRRGFVVTLQVLQQVTHVRKAAKPSPMHGTHRSNTS